MFENLGPIPEILSTQKDSRQLLSISTGVVKKLFSFKSSLLPIKPFLHTFRTQKFELANFKKAKSF